MPSLLRGRDRGPLAVCLKTSAAIPGGVWRHLVELADGVAEHGIEVRVEVPPGLQVQAAGLGLLKPRPRAELLHVHLANTYDLEMTWRMLLARAQGRRVVITEHLPRSDASDPTLASRPPRPLAPLLKTVLKRVQYAVADRVIGVSQGSGEFLAARYGTRPGLVEVVANGVAAVEPVDRPAPRPYPLIVATGAVIAQKGFDLLVEAARSATRDWAVHVLGTGTHLDDLRSQAAGLQTTTGEPRLQFLGWSDEVDLMISRADAMVVPSRWEGLPYGALEAMALGKPLIATTVDGLSEIVIDGQTGFLVEPDAEGLRSALDAFSELSVDEVAAMGDRGRARVRDGYTLVAMVDKTVEVYRSVWTARSRPW